MNEIKNFVKDRDEMLFESVINSRDGYIKVIEQYKAENERLKNHIQEGIDLAKQIPEMVAPIKAEAYKECIGKVKEEIKEALKSNYKARAEREQKIPIHTEDEFLSYCSGKIDCLRGLDDFCDNLLKEMVGEDNASKN